MPHRPSLRAVVATTTAAVVLVGGAQLASYAATHHGHGAGASAPASGKTVVFTLGKPKQQFPGGSVQLFTAKVPKGRYAISISGIVVPHGITTSANIGCVLVDRETLKYIQTHSGSLKGAQRLYNFLNQESTDTDFGFLDQTTPAAKVDRTKIVYGCVFNADVPFQVLRPIQFTMTPVKVTPGKSTGKYHIPAAKARQLAHALR